MQLLNRLLAFGQSPPKKVDITQTSHEISHDTQVLSITRPSTEKNWLCPYGPERIDEAHRYSNIAVPERITFKWYEMIDA